MKYSFLIPVYNVEKYVKECIESVLNQTYKNFEAIIVNDGSTDKTLDIIQKYEIIDNRVKVVNQKNKGICAVRKKLIEEASGDYILFIDGDDYIDKNMLFEINEILKDNQVDLITFDYTEIYSNEKVLKSDNNRELTMVSGEEASREFIKHNKFFDMVLWRRCYSKKLISEISFPDNILPEDYFVSFDIYSKSDKVIHYNRSLYNYICRNDGLTVRKDLKGLNNDYIVHKYVYEKELKYFEDKEIIKTINKNYLFKLITLLSMLTNIKTQYNEKKELQTKIKLDIKKIKCLDMKAMLIKIMYIIFPDFLYLLIKQRNRIKFRKRSNS